jgi:hypothetical protein
MHYLARLPCPTNLDLREKAELDVCMQFHAFFQRSPIINVVGKKKKEAEGILKISWMSLKQLVFTTQIS